MYVCISHVSAFAMSGWGGEDGGECMRMATAVKGNACMHLYASCASLEGWLSLKQTEPPVPSGGFRLKQIAPWGRLGPLTPRHSCTCRAGLPVQHDRGGHQLPAAAGQCAGPALAPPLPAAAWPPAPLGASRPAQFVGEHMHGALHAWDASMRKWWCPWRAHAAAESQEESISVTGGSPACTPVPRCGATLWCRAARTTPARPRPRCSSGGSPPSSRASRLSGRRVQICACDCA